jgi:chromosome segregation ATPase
MNRLLLALALLVSSGLVIWNVRLERENHRLAAVVRELRRAPKPARTATPKPDPEIARLQDKIKDEQENVDAIQQRLRESEALVAAADDVGAMKRDMLDQKAVVDESSRELQTLGPAPTAPRSVRAVAELRRKVNQQIQAEQRQLTALRDQAASLTADGGPQSQRSLVGVRAQIQTEQKLLQALQEQRGLLGQAGANGAAETPQTAQTRADLQAQLAAETDSYQRLKSRYDQAARETHADSHETQRLQNELAKHQSRVRDLQAQAKRRQTRQTASVGSDAADPPVPSDQGDPQ